MNKTELSKLIPKTQKSLAEMQAVFAQYPDAIYTVDADGLINQFSSEIVNFCYQLLDFEHARYSSNLYVHPYVEVKYQFDQQEHIVRVYSSGRILLMKKKWSRSTRTYTLVFTKLKFNLKHRKFDNKMISDCASAMIEYIGKNPNATLDKSNIDPRIDKLLSFM